MSVEAIVSALASMGGKYIDGQNFSRTIHDLQTQIREAIWAAAQFVIDAVREEFQQQVFDECEAEARAAAKLLLDWERQADKTNITRLYNAEEKLQSAMERLAKYPWQGVLAYTNAASLEMAVQLALYKTRHDDGELENARALLEMAGKYTTDISKQIADHFVSLHSRLVPCSGGIDERHKRYRCVGGREERECTEINRYYAHFNDAIHVRGYYDRQTLDDAMTACNADFAVANAVRAADRDRALKIQSVVAMAIQSWTDAIGNAAAVAHPSSLRASPLLDLPVGGVRFLYGLRKS